MQYIDHGGEVEVIIADDFDLARIFECGQCFRWDADGRGEYTGVAHGCAARIRRDGGSVFISGGIEDFLAVWHDYFDLDRNYAKVRQELCIDDFMTRACAFGAGIRILRQERWEALCSFIISQCNNIPRIKKIIVSLCEKFGDAITFDGREYHTFPSAMRLAVLQPEDLKDIRAGYRAGYIISAARAVADGDLDLDALARGSAAQARAELMRLRGVGRKVADCAVLFGLHHLDAFPMDVWMKRAVGDNYGSDFDPAVFSPYAGLAQQYMFYYAREQGVGNSLGEEL